MLDERLLEILVCPETKQPLRMASPEESVRAKLEHGLIREDGQLIYPIQDGIPMLMAEHAVRIEPPRTGDR